MCIRAILTFCLAFFACSLVHAQKELQQMIDLRLDDTSIPDALRQISQASQINIIFSDNSFEGTSKVQLNAQKWTIKRLLNRILSNTDTRYTWQNQQIIIHEKEIPYFTYSGYVIDGKSGEPLIGATVALTSLQKGTYTNEYGFFSISLPREKYEFQVSYTGYEPVIRSVYLLGDRTTRIKLASSLTLEEIVVRGSTNTLRLDGLAAPNKYTLSTPFVEIMPALGGESDAFRVAQLLPGVQTGADGLGGLHVRGGSSDQNLVLFDGVPVYNPNHALGLFSIFDMQTVRSFQLLKGNFPAKYGGRLSAVMDVRTREGNTNHFYAAVSSGLIASKAMFEGPIKKEKGAFIVTYRRTHLDYLLKILSRNMRQTDNQNGFYNYAFQDFLAKAHYSISEKDKIYLSFYQGQDNFQDQKEVIDRFSFSDRDIRIEVKDHQRMKWGNRLIALRWNREMTNKTFANLTATFSQFNFNSKKSFMVDYFENDMLTDGLPEEIFESRSNIRSQSLGVDFKTTFTPQFHIEYGAKVNLQQFRPGNLSFRVDSIEQSFPDQQLPDEVFSPSIHTSEYGAYVDGSWVINKKLQLNAGLRADIFANQSDIFHAIQPRVGISFLLHPKIKTYTYYGQMAQFLHVLTEANFGLPEDTWVPSTRLAPPQESSIYEWGLQYQIAPQYALRLDAYYKDLDHLIDLKPGEPLYTPFNGSDMDIAKWENKITRGNGEAYGLELLIEKQKGKLQGGVGYTWSKATRNFDGINNAIPFNYRYDQRHTLNIFADYQLNKEIIVSFKWMFGTGHLVSLPVGQYIFPEGPYYVDYEKNNFRLPHNHRLDVSFRYSKEKKWGKYSASLGIYNAYNRNNPFNIIYQPSYFQIQQPRYLEVYLLPILPYFSIKFEF